MISKVTPQVLGRQVAERLRYAVWSGRYGPGEPIREQRIAEEFEVSRGPVRDAILELTKEGLLVAVPNRGAKVRPRVGEQTRRLLVKMRLSIESHALRRGLRSLSPAMVEAFGDNLKRFREVCAAGAWPEVVQTDMAFHRLIIDLNREEDLSVVWLPIMVQLTLPYSRHHDLMESYEEHRQIFEAIAAGQKDAALLALKKNIR